MLANKTRFVTMLGLLTLAPGCMPEMAEYEPLPEPVPAGPAKADAPVGTDSADPVSLPLLPCEANMGNVVARDPASTHCYMFFSEPKSYDDAYKACNAISTHTHLATLNSRAEDQMVTAMLGTTTETWFGFDDIMLEGTFIWNTLEANLFSNWAAGQPDDPDDGVSERDCAMKTGTLGQWDDRDCATLAAYVCERDR